MNDLAIMNAGIFLITVLWYPLIFIIERDLSITITIAIYFLFAAIGNTVMIVVKIVDYTSQSIH